MKNLYKIKKVLVIFIFLLSFFFGPHQAKADITTGLVGYWNFDAGSGTVAADSSGNGNTGTLTNGPTWTTGKIGSGALSFDGNNDYVAQNNSNSFASNDITMSAWIKPGTVSGSQMILNSETNNGNFRLMLYNNQINAYWGGGASYHVTSNANLTVGNWYHIVATISGGSKQITIYLNGSQILSEADSNLNLFTGISSLQLSAGGTPLGNTGFFNGIIDDARVYSRVLASSDVAQLYSLGGGSSPTPTPTPSPTPTSGSLLTSPGWHDIPNTKLRTLCPQDNFGGEIYAFSFYCQNITDSWSSGIFDTLRNREIVWGGGHTSYYGNELYSFDLNDLSIHRLNNPSIPTNYHGGTNTCIAALSDGTPNTRHTYDSLSYLPNVDKLLALGGGSVGCETGGFGSASNTWTFDFSTMTWHFISTSGSVPSPDVYTTAYDPNTGKIFLHSSYNFYVYDYNTNNFTKLGPDTYVDYHLTAVIDPVRKKYIMIGNGQAWYYDISSGSNYTRQTLTTTGGDTIVNAVYPGLAYDPVIDRIVAWAGGDTVYVLNLDTGVWTPQTYSGGPGPQSTTGTYKRWSYSPTSNLFVLVNSMDQDVFTFRLSSGGTPLPPSPADTTPPSVPTNLSASAISSSQINLSWTASTDSVGVSGYKIFRGGVQIGTSATNSYSDINLSASTVYSYTVSAYDVAGNNSSQSAGAAATTQSVAPPPSGSQTFTQKCAQSGVVACYGFDSITNVRNTPGITAPYPMKYGGWAAGTVCDNAGLGTNYYYTQGRNYGTPTGSLEYNAKANIQNGVCYWPNIDTSTSASGPGALRIEVPSGADQSNGGYFDTTFKGMDQPHARIGPDNGAEIWYQYGYRTHNMANNDFGGAFPNTFTKSFIFCATPPGLDYCGSDVTMSNVIGYYSGYTNTQGQAVSRNGVWTGYSRTWEGYVNPFERNFNNVIYVQTGSMCAYTGAEPYPTPPCIKLIDDTWQEVTVHWKLQPVASDFSISGNTLSRSAATFNSTNVGRYVYIVGDGYYSITGYTDPTHVTLSGTPAAGSGKTVYISAYPNTIVQFYVNGQLVMNTTDQSHPWDMANPGWGEFRLIPHQTNKTPNTTYTPGTVWYDDVIISTQPIAMTNGSLPFTPISAPSTPSVPTPDTTPPSVSLTTPISGSTLSGSSVPLSATASDNIAVSKVSFRIDTTNIIEDTALPYAALWNTTLFSNGTHTIYVTATDSSGNTTTNQITVTVNNTAPVTPPPTTPPPTPTPSTPPPSSTTTGGSTSGSSSSSSGGGTPSTSQPALSLVPTPPSLTPPPGQKVTLTKTLSLGSRNSEVVLLQRFLITLGYLGAGNTTGYFGTLTRAAVRKYQCATLQICSGNESTTGWGMVGKKTRARMGK